MKEIYNVNKVTFDMNESLTEWLARVSWPVLSGQVLLGLFFSQQ